MNIDWSLKEIQEDLLPANVFTTFACGGGSSMGYKLAGMKILARNEIDANMYFMYDANFNVKYQFDCDIRQLINQNIPDELHNIDILDGSPPCTTFSTAGLRENAWNIEKEYAEGRHKQRLDDLVFYFLELAYKIQPKIIVMENVSGLATGAALEYVTLIYKNLNMMNYQAAHWLLNAERMNVPQSRERFILLAMRNDLCSISDIKCNLGTQLPYIDMNFNEPIIPLKDILNKSIKKKITQHYSESRFGDHICDLEKPLPTLTTIDRYWINEEEYIDDKTMIRAQTFPYDYDFYNNNIKYVLGMSVPPFMMMNIANRIKKYWLDKILLK